MKNKWRLRLLFGVIGLYVFAIIENIEDVMFFGGEWGYFLQNTVRNSIMLPFHNTLASIMAGNYGFLIFDIISLILFAEIIVTIIELSKLKASKHAYKEA